MTLTCAAGALAERRFEQRPLLEIVREQDQLRRRLVVVELGEEGAEHRAGLEPLVGAREIGAVAPVLAGAEEEHLDAGLAAVLMDGEDIRLFEGLRVDALMALDVGERGEPVAIAGGLLEIEPVGSLRHRRLHGGAHRLAAAGEEVLAPRRTSAA